MLIPERRQQALLDRLYTAPFQTGGWQAFLAELVSGTHSRSARLLVLNQGADQVLSSVQTNTDKRAYQAYVDHFVNLCPWRPELKKKTPGQLYSTYLDFSCDQKNFYRTEFFNDWARELDIHHGACGTVWRHNDLTIQLMLQRTGGQGHYDANAMREINQLLPHLRRALHMESLQQQQRHQHAATTRAHNCPAMILLDQRGKIVHISEEAGNYLSDRSPVGIRDQRLNLYQVGAQQQLHKVIADALAGHLGNAGGVINVSRPGRADLRLLVTPVHPDTTDSGLFPARAHAAVFIVDVEAFVDIDEALLASLLGLTAAEARVAAATAQGLSPAEQARLFNVSVHTARSQLKSVFRKTGTTSQSQLGSLVMSSPAAQRRHAPSSLQLDTDGGA